MKVVFKKYWLWVLIFGFDVLLVVLHIYLRKKLGFFDLDKEQNFSSVYSGVKLFVVATAAGGLSYLALINRHRFESWLWGLAAAGFIFIAFDDMMAIHERIGFVLNNWTGLGGFYGESFNWMIYFAPFIGLAVLVYAKLIQLLWQADRTNALWMLVGTALFVLSLMSEAVGAKLLLAPRINTAIYFKEIIIEEFFEMAGATCFLISTARTFQERFAKTFTRRS